MKTTQPRSNRRKGLTTRLKGQRSPEEDNTITRTKDTKTRRHGTDATKIIDNNQITRRNNFRSEEVFPRPWNVAIDYVPDVTPYPRIRIFFNPQLFFFADTVSVHTYPVNPSGIRIRNSPEWKFLNTLWMRKFVDARSRIFSSGDVE